MKLYLTLSEYLSREEISQKENISNASVISIADYLNKTTNNLNSVQNCINNEVSPEINQQGEEFLKGLRVIS